MVYFIFLSYVYYFTDEGFVLLFYSYLCYPKVKIQTEKSLFSDKMWTLILLQLLWLGRGIRCQESEYPDCSWNIYQPSGQWKPCKTEKRCQCWTQLVNTTQQTIVSCKDSNLTNVPIRLPSTTVFLDLSANSIKDLGVQMFKGYPNLINLTVAQNEITEIKVGVFDGIKNLHCLSLRNNSIRYNSMGFQPGTFAPLKTLKTLNIQQRFNQTDFKDESYNIAALNDLTYLEKLFLDGIPNQNLGNVFKNLTSLKELIFNGQWGRCLLYKLTPKFFPHNISITHLTINCSVVQIEAKSFEQLTHLRLLDLSYNENLTFKSLSNITDGLHFTNIAILKLNKIYTTYGPCTILTEENLNHFKKLMLKDIYLESNRIATFESKAVRNIPLTLKSISLRNNLLLSDKYVTDLLVHLSRSDIETITISDQFISRDISLFLPFIPTSDFHRSSLNTRKTKRKTSKEQDDIFNPKGQGQFRHRQKRKLLQYVGGQELIKSEKDLVQSIKVAVNKTGMITSYTSRHMKRHLDNNDIIKQKDWLTSPENRNENKFNWVWKKDAYGNIIFKLPNNLTCVDASNMAVRVRVRGPYIVATPNNLRELNVSRNSFWQWDGPILGLKNLTKLDLSWNDCIQMSQYFFQDGPNLQFLNLSRNYLGTSISKDKNGSIFQSLGKLDILDLSDNRLTELPKQIFVGLNKLTKLYLGNNLLTEFKVILSHLRFLERLDLSNNQLTTIEESLRTYFDGQIQIANFSLNLVGNNFKCDCENIDFLKWISKSHVEFENIHNYVCYYGNDVSKTGNLSNAKDIYQELEKHCYNYTPLIVMSTATVVLVLSLTGAATVYRYRWNLRYMYYMAKYKTRGVNLKPRGYQPVVAAEDDIKDVNISYADEDSEFVRQKLYPELEINRGVTLYIRDRNAPVDQRYICDNILDAIEGTRKTLIVMSEAYLDHKWCIFEMNMAGIKALRSDSSLLCVLMMERVPHKDLPLKIMKIIKDQEFLEYPGPQDLEDCFWDRLHDLCTN